MRQKLMLIFLAVMFSVQGCKLLTPPIEQPVIEQHAQNRVNTFAVIPSRRVIIVKSELPLTDIPNARSKDKDILVCGEAPADVTDNLASALSSSISAAPPLSAAGEKAASAAAALSKSLQTFGQFLFKRSQGLQLFRDRAASLCMARMNGFISNEEYKSALKGAFDDVIPLIEKELPYLKAEGSQAPKTQVNIETPSSVSSGTSVTSTISSDGKVDSKVESAKPNATSPESKERKASD